MIDVKVTCRQCGHEQTLQMDPLTTDDLENGVYSGNFYCTEECKKAFDASVAMLAAITNANSDTNAALNDVIIRAIGQ